MKTTLNKIREHSPCKQGWEKLLRSLNKTKEDDEPISIVQIIDSNGIDDALWCLRAVSGYDREIRLFAVWCARQVQHLMKDQRSIDSLDVAERFANGLATESELDDARASALDAAWATERASAWPAAWSSARAAAWSSTRAAWDAAEGAAWGAGEDASVAAARAEQEKELRRVCAEIESREVNYD